jgi:hypothetical protein
MYQRRGANMKHTAVVLIFACLSAPTTFAQMSAYGSLSSGYHRNPLCNYENISDQLQQTYLEAGYNQDYDWSQLDLRYISGLTLFTHLTERTYYEHLFRTSYDIRLHDESKDSEGDTTGVDPADSTDNFFHAAAIFSARHDTKAFDEFNNIGAQAQVAYRIFLADNYFSRITGSAGTRSYTSLTGLSNSYGSVSAEFGSQYKGKFQWGFLCGGGSIRYINATYDTSLFEETPSFIVTITQTNTGSGKGGISFDTSISPSDKTLLARPSTKASYQLQAGLYCAFSWDSGSVRIEGCFRKNYKTAIHMLVQNLTTVHLNEDIYNDVFSYEGPEALVLLQQQLPLKIHGTFSFESGRRSFAVPAMDIASNITAATRFELHSEGEMYLSRGFSLFGFSGLEISLDAAYVRNQSNDMYNDYSTWSLAAAIGVSL